MAGIVMIHSRFGTMPSFLLVVDLLLMASLTEVQSSDIDCDSFKYLLNHPDKDDFCLECKICPMGITEREIYKPCQQKLPDSIPGQGNAWCSGRKHKLPWCPPLPIQNGALNCSRGDAVYSKCKLQCSQGYKPVNEALTVVECLENLLWNVTDLQLFNCKRAAIPNKPTVSSVGQISKVISGSDKTLTCTTTSQVVGRIKVYWYFKDKKLPCDPDKTTYVITGASKENEGEYYCQLEDELGKSELSAGYFLHVDNAINKDPGWKIPAEVIGGIVAVTLLVVIGMCIKKKQCHGYGSSNGFRNIECFFCKNCKTADTPAATPSSTSSESSCDSSKTTISGSDPENQLLLEPETIKKDPYPNAAPLSEKISVSKNKDVLINLQSKPCPSDFCETGVGNLGKNAKEISISDQENLRSLIKNPQLMRELRIRLDQIAGTYIEKPTFHSLGRFLGVPNVEIAHLEFVCKQNDWSPTEKYILKMAERGLGLHHLLTFLKNHESTEQLAQDIEHQICMHNSKSEFPKHF